MGDIGWMALVENPNDIQIGAQLKKALHRFQSNSKFFRVHGTPDGIGIKGCGAAKKNKKLYGMVTWEDLLNNCF